ncbi:MAG TPA: hypothetical protein VFA20_04625 [Myxococcaceae bacterium]|nr:hypothetical protein [Myxococcaceae bacterium]
MTPPRRIHPSALSLLILALPLAASAGAPQLPPLLDRAKETAAALKACPAHVQEGAGVYALEKGGYVKVRDSKNGFTAIINRTFVNSFEPQCLDAEGTRTFLPWYLKAAELRAQGKSKEEVKKAIEDGFAGGTFKAPARAGIDYMLSTENVVPIDEKGNVAPYPPHLMMYVPGLKNADLGSDGNPMGPAFVVDEGTPKALLIVPVVQPPADAQQHKH